MNIIGKTGVKWRGYERFILQCEFCGNKQEQTGIDDVLFTEGRVPEIECTQCGKSTFGEYLNEPDPELEEEE